ncbi:MAG: hypothetical protein MJA83_05875 [Gammaproteobacteria bacterium]|nr:hypothetical protein [Gammaproteobacteria bacterium]
MMHTDALLEQGIDFAEHALHVANWFDILRAAGDDAVIEGVAVARGLRQWLREHENGKPVDRIFWFDHPLVELTPAQDAMRVGIDTIWSGILEELHDRGVRIDTGRAVF